MLNTIHQQITNKFITGTLSAFLLFSFTIANQQICLASEQSTHSEESTQSNSDHCRENTSDKDNSLHAEAADLKHQQATQTGQLPSCDHECDNCNQCDNYTPSIALGQCVYTETATEHAYQYQSSYQKISLALRHPPPISFLS